MNVGGPDVEDAEGAPVSHAGRSKILVVKAWRRVDDGHWPASLVATAGEADRPQAHATLAHREEALSRRFANQLAIRCMVGPFGKAISGAARPPPHNSGATTFQLLDRANEPGRQIAYCRHGEAARSAPDPRN